MGLSVWQCALVVVLFMLLFGRGRLSGLMTDLADGIKSFRAGLSDDDVPQKLPDRSDLEAHTDQAETNSAERASS